VTTDECFHKADEEGHRDPNERQDLSADIETSSNKIPECSKETKTGTLPLSSNSTNQEQPQVDPQELLSMVVVTDPTDDVIYIQLPPDSEGEAMGQYCESVLFPAEGDTFLSVENFNKRSSGGDRSTSSNSIGCEATAMLPLGVEEVEEVDGADEVKAGEQMVLIKGIPTERRSERKNELDEEMAVIEVPSGGAEEYMSLPQHEMDEGQGQESGGYHKVVTQSLQGPVPEETTAGQQQQYLVIFK
jgi:hypothetical protein